MSKDMNFTTKIAVAIAFTIIGMIIISTSAYLGLNKIGAEIEEITELEKDILEKKILTYELIIASSNVKSQNVKDIEHKISALDKRTDHTVKEADKLIKQLMHQMTVLLEHSTHQTESYEHETLPIIEIISLLILLTSIVFLIFIIIKEQITHAINSQDQQAQENPMIANKTYDLGMKTDNISKLVFINANKKQFKEKGNIKTRTLTNPATEEKIRKPKFKLTESGVQNRRAPNSRTHEKVINNSSEVEDEWRIF